MPNLRESDVDGGVALQSCSAENSAWAQNSFFALAMEPAMLVLEPEGVIF